MKVTLRQATAQDEPFLRGLILGVLFEQLNAWAWDEKIRQPLLEMQLNARRQGHAAQYPHAESSIVLADEAMAGQIIVARSETEIRLVDICIAPDFRGQGIGTMLIRDLLTEANVTRRVVGLQVTSHNPALRLYERLGFQRTGGDEVVFEMTSGQPVCT